MDATFVDQCMHPITSEKPAGEDSRYEPEYGAVLAEIEKLSFSGQGDAPSWPLVEEQGTAILTAKSKDILIASYLAVALWHNNGMEGMLAGVRLLSGLLGAFWETAWPPLKRIRARVNAFDWWHERTLAFVQDQVAKNVTLSAGKLQALLDALAALDARASSLLPDAAPLRDLTAAVRRLSPPPAQDGQSPDAAPSSGQGRNSDAQPAPPHSATPDKAASGDPSALRRLFAAAGQNYLAAARRAEPVNATLWRLNRLILWGGITALPGAENGRTLLPVPDMDALVRARQKFEEGKALEAVLDAEDFFAAAPFCLDVQPLIHQALSSLDRRFAEAAQAVREENARFLIRLPGIEKLAFSDGTPFAGPQASGWLQNSLRLVRSSDDRAARSSGAAEEQYLAKAKDLLGQNRLPDALDLLDAARKDSPAENLRLSLAQLYLLCEAGQRAAALALADALLEQITTRDLDNWDAKLALDVLSAVRGAFTLFDAQNAQKLNEVLRRMARLRPSAILE
jgi:type VI secretion system protein VasJ